MRIVIAGAHGQIARLLGRQLNDDGHDVVGLVRNPSHLDDLAADGSRGVLCDLEEHGPETIATHLGGADALVFAAGAGHGSGAARKETVDFAGAVKCRDAARLARVPRYVVVSSMGTDDPPQDNEVFSVYLRAKARADQEVMRSDLDWTIVRPGRLTNDEPRGTVRVGRHVGRSEVPRADVAAVLAAVLAEPATTGRILEVVTGDTPVAEAVARAAG